MLSCVQLFATSWTIVCQAHVSIGFSWQEYWSGLPFPSPGDLPGPGMKPTSPVSPALAGEFFTTEPPGKPRVALDSVLKCVILSIAWCTHQDQHSFGCWASICPVLRNMGIWKFHQNCSSPAVMDGSLRTGIWSCYLGACCGNATLRQMQCFRTKVT